MNTPLYEILDLPLDRQEEQAQENADHIVKSLEFAQKKLLRYYKGAGEVNGMSYRSMLKVYNEIDATLDLFKKIDGRVRDNIEKNKSEEKHRNTSIVSGRSKFPKDPPSETEND